MRTIALFVGLLLTGLVAYVALPKPKPAASTCSEWRAVERPATSYIGKTPVPTKHTTVECAS